MVLLFVRGAGRSSRKPPRSKEKSAAVPRAAAARNNFSPICLPDSSISKTANVPSRHHPFFLTTFFFLVTVNVPGAFFLFARIMIEIKKVKAIVIRAGKM